MSEQDVETWKQRVRQRTSAAVRREDEVRDLAYEVGKEVQAKIDKEIACTGIDGVDVVNCLVGSEKFKDLIKQCLREVLEEAVKT